MKRFQRNRLGYTLFELCMTMSLGSSIMMLGIGAIHQAMRYSSLANTWAEQDRSLTRLDRDFREDVHAAIGCAIEGNNSLVLRMIGDVEVTYLAVESKVLRRVDTDGVQTHQEEYQMNSNSVVEINILAEPDRAMMVIGSNSIGKRQDQRIDRQMIAVVGQRISLSTSQVEAGGE